ncbi:RluA family pseudouridine synthase [Candidatus Dojkabacteria bacterium]|nr:RluA family pseudouridine synthase [Candidatus Dojkabacteria bacterium]
MKNQSVKIIVSKEGLGKRLDIFLGIKLNTFSRSLIKKLIESNNVRINDVVEYRANYKPKIGDKIEINIDPSVLNDRNILEPENIPLNIVYEDDELLAVNKPYGMVVHPANGNWSGTLMNAVMFHYSSQMSTISNSIRAGLIHRIDKETSGLVLIGKTSLALFHFTKLFSERKVRKSYLLLAEGSKDIIRDLKDHSIVENMLGRNPLNRKKVRSYKFGTNENSSNNVRVAKTHFYKIAYNGNLVFLLAKPETGRTHQIRVHCNDLGLRILGDKVYGKNNSLDRMMLHSYMLTLKNIDGNELVLKALPEIDFLNLLIKNGFNFKDIENKIINLGI